MTPDMVTGLLVFAGMIIMVLLGVPIFLSMLAGSFVGFIAIGGIKMMIVQFTTAPFSWVQTIHMRSCPCSCWLARWPV